MPGLFSSIFGSKGSINFLKVLESSNGSSSSMCNFEIGGFLLVSVVILVQNMLKLSYTHVIFNQ